MKLDMLAEARAEAVEAAEWYHYQRDGLGDEFLEALSATFEQIEGSPRSFARLETYNGPRMIRRALLRRFPYMVIFEERGESVLAIAVAHVRRHPGYWTKRLSSNN
jgi:hypothetical protein